MFSIQEIIANDKRLPKLEIKLILQHILNKNAVQLITHDNYKLTDGEYSQLNQLVAKRQAGTPIAYIIGHKEFYSREFRVNEHTLVPRPETELLIDTALQLAKPSDRILDAGTGSGCIAITLKLESPTLIVDALDNYPATLDIAEENALKLGAQINFIYSNWFEEITKKYNLIVSNPPYIANNDNHLANLCAEPQHALTDFNDGLNCIREIIANSKNHLILGGYILIEHGYDQGQAIRDLYQQQGFANIKTLQDYAGLDRITLAQYL